MPPYRWPKPILVKILSVPFRINADTGNNSTGIAPKTTELQGVIQPAKTAAPNCSDFRCKFHPPDRGLKRLYQRKL